VATSNIWLSLVGAAVEPQWGSAVLGREEAVLADTYLR